MTTQPSDPSREFDVVLVGATGFAGRHTAAHLAAHAPAGLKVALAGRSAERLAALPEDLRRRLGGEHPALHWPRVVADVTDAGAAADLAARARVVATTVGPFGRYGRELVAACAAAGTHYADITGETLFVRDVIDAHDERARATGSRIVPACGFDSVPSDLAVWLTARQVEADGAGTLADTVLHVLRLRGGLGGGTVDTAREMARAAATDPSLRRLLGSPNSLSPKGFDQERRAPAAPGSVPRGPLGGLRRFGQRVGEALPIGRDRDTGRFTAPFMMAAFNRQIVRRSHALTGGSYGAQFRYDEVSDTGAGPAGAARAVAVTAASAGLAIGLAVPVTRPLVDRLLPAPGEGPSEEAIAAGSFLIEVRAHTSTGAEYATRFGAGLDPGFGGTGAMLAQSALALALDDLPDRAGVLTPAVAFGEALTERLRAVGFTIEVRLSRPSP